MDPFSITAACSSLAFAIVRNGRALAVLFDKYQNAQHSIFMIQTECTVLAAALSQLEASVTDPKASRLSHCPPSFVDALDLSLTGCTLTLSVLDKEISRLTEDATNAAIKMKKADKAKYLWREESMNELLQQLRGQSSALMLLLKALDSSSINQILGMMQAGGPTFRRVRKGAESIRKAHPKDNYAESVFDMPFDDTKTIYSIEMPGKDASSLQSWDDSTTAASAHTEPAKIPEIEYLPKGWKKVYSHEYNQWFFVNAATRTSQWEHPGQPSAPEQPSTVAVRQERRTPSGTRLAQQQSDAGTESFAKLTLQEQRGPKVLEEQTLDLAPWLLNTQAKLEKRLDGIRKEHSVSALAAGIVPIDGPPELFIRGLRRKDLDVAVTRSDRFTLANNDTMTFMLLALLVDKGLLSWDDKLVERLPAISTRAHPFHRDTTLGMLASHRSGLSETIYAAGNSDLYTYLSSSEVSAKEGRLALALNYLVRRPDHDPGSKYWYHQVNAVLLASAIEEVMKKPFETLLKEELFDPLEMYSAGYGWPDRTRNTATDPTQPWPHSGESKQPSVVSAGRELNMNSMYPSQGVHCSAADYAAYVRFQLRCIMGLDTGGLLSEENMHRLHQATTDDASITVTYTYAGYNRTERDWSKGLAHCISSGGFGATNTVWLCPGLGKAFFVVTNIDLDCGMKVVEQAVWDVIRFDRDRAPRS